jgi:transcriptional regulator with XRE-family HTH domain
MPRPEPKLPAAYADIEASLDGLREAIWDIAFHDEPLSRDTREEIEEIVSDLLRAAIAERTRRMSEAMIEDGTLRPVTFGEVVARSVKLLRERATITQQQLAVYMERLGFVSWKRITVAEVESGKRKLSIEEMVGLAALFDAPVASVLCAFESREALALNERWVVTSGQAQELVTGESLERSWLGVRLYDTNTGNAIGSEDAGFFLEEDWRPAEAVWGTAVEAEGGMFIVREGLYPE